MRGSIWVDTRTVMSRCKRNNQTRPLGGLHTGTRRFSGIFAGVFIDMYRDQLRPRVTEAFALPTHGVWAGRLRSPGHVHVEISSTNVLGSRYVPDRRRDHRRPPEVAVPSKRRGISGRRYDTIVPRGQVCVEFVLLLYSRYFGLRAEFCIE